MYVPTYMRCPSAPTHTALARMHVIRNYQMGEVVHTQQVSVRRGKVCQDRVRGEVLCARTKALH